MISINALQLHKEMLTEKNTDAYKRIQAICTQCNTPKEVLEKIYKEAKNYFYSDTPEKYVYSDCMFLLSESDSLSKACKDFALDMSLLLAEGKESLITIDDRCIQKTE